MLPSAVTRRVRSHQSKRIVISSLAVLLMAWSGSASADPVLRVAPSSTNVNPEAVFSVDFLITGVTDLNAVQLAIVFDSSVLQVLNSSQGAFLPSAGTTIPF